MAPRASRGVPTVATRPLFTRMVVPLATRAGGRSVRRKPITPKRPYHFCGGAFFAVWGAGSKSVWSANFAPTFRERAPHLRRVNCGLAPLFGTKFPRPYEFMRRRGCGSWVVNPSGGCFLRFSRPRIAHLLRVNSASSVIEGLETTSATRIYALFAVFCLGQCGV